MSDPDYIAICQTEIQTCTKLPLILLRIQQNLRKESLQLYEFAWLLQNVTLLLSPSQLQ